LKLIIKEKNKIANITPQMVKDLREMTGAGMGDCKMHSLKLMAIQKKQLKSS